MIVNDGGGTIFSGLEHAAAAPENFERVFTTPHGVAIAPLCAAYGAGYSMATNAAELTQALRRVPRGIEIVEAVVPRS